MELFDGNLLDRSAAEMRRMLADNGLELVATYAGGNFIFDDILPEELAPRDARRRPCRRNWARRIWWWAGTLRFDGTREPDYHKLGAALDQ